MTVRVVIHGRTARRGVIEGQVPNSNGENTLRLPRAAQVEALRQHQPELELSRLRAELGLVGLSWAEQLRS